MRARRRAKAVAKLDERTSRAELPGYLWHPVIEYSVADVWATIDGAGLRRHVAYTAYGSTRVSCWLCVLASEHDLRAALSCSDHYEVYVELVELEARSGFSFQSSRWLADLAPSLLSTELLARVAQAKERAVERRRLESAIPQHLMFLNEQPVTMPSAQEAALLARVRREVGQLQGIPMRYTTCDAVQARYAQLLREGKKGLKRHLDGHELVLAGFEGVLQLDGLATTTDRAGQLALAW